MQGQNLRETPSLVNIPVGDPFECAGMDFVEFGKSSTGNYSSKTTLLSAWLELYA